MRRTLLQLSMVALGVSVLAPGGRVAIAQAPGPFVATAIHHGKSKALRDIPRRVPTGPRREHPVRQFPEQPGGPGGDGAVQSLAVTGMPVLTGPSFEGIGEGSPNAPYNVNSAPSDINGAVGATQYVQWVNTAFAVFDKATGALLAGPTAGNTLWDGTNTNCDLQNDGDPIAQYDKAAQRWIMTQFQVSTQPFSQCVAVSDTSDATGTYNLYEFAYSGIPDYPKLAVWPDAYYITFNLFNNQGTAFLGGLTCAYERDQMMAGLAARQVCFQISSGGLLPSDLDGSTPPPAGSPNVVTNFGTNSLRFWKFHVDWANTANSTFTGPTTVAVASFTAACPGFFRRTCVPQGGTTQLLESLGDRLMYRLAYRNFGTHQSLAVNHSVDVSGSTAMRWYEIRNPHGTPTVHQQSTYMPDSLQRWMGSSAMDKFGNMAIGYSVSSTAISPAIRFAGREAADPLSTLGVETTIIPGGGSQTGGLARWGDYSAMSLDPADDCTFWYTNQYLKANGAFNWTTRIASFSFPGCGTPPPGDFSISATPESRSVIQGQTTTYDVEVTPTGSFSGSVALSVSGLPSGATANFNPASVSPADWTSVLTITSSGSTPTGTYPLTITGTSGVSHTTNVTLVVTAQPDFTMSLSPGSRNIKAGQSTTYTITIGSINGFAGTVSLSVAGGHSTMTFSPTSVPVGSRSWGVTTTSATPKGIYTLVVTGSSAGLSNKTASVNLRVR